MFIDGADMMRVGGFILVMIGVWRLGYHRGFFHMRAVLNLKDATLGLNEELIKSLEREIKSLNKDLKEVR